MIQSTEGCRWVLCSHSKQQNTPGNDNSNPNQQWEHQKRKHNYYCIAASLRHDQTFNRVSQISITCSQSVCSLIYTACQAHVPYYIIICGLFGSIFPQFHKTAQFSTTCKETQNVCWFSLQKEVLHENGDSQKETNSCFHNFAKVPNSYNTHIP